ncbi:hypothetical protein V8F20_009001 [Naviculisporaceae sp. PSN 640]
MTANRKKRQASSTAHLIPSELTDDGFIPSSPIPPKRTKTKRSHNVGDGWLWRPSRPKIPSPNLSPIPFPWEQISPLKYKEKISPAKTEKSQIKAPPSKQKEKDMGAKSTSKDLPPVSSSDSEPYSSEYSSEEEGEVEDTQLQPTKNIGHTPGAGAKLKNDQDTKALAERLDLIKAKMNDRTAKETRNEVMSLRESVRLLEERIQRNEMRAAIRHDILFDALKKISQDINNIRSNSNAMMTGMSSFSASEDNSASASDIESTSSPSNKRRSRVTKEPKPQKARSSQTGPVAARKTMERCLDQYMEELNSAATTEEVKKRGELCKKYAENLIKTYI